MIGKLLSFIFTPPKAETIADKVARSLSQNGNSAPTILHLAPFNLEERTELFKLLPDKYSPNIPGVETIEFPEQLGDIRKRFNGWLSGKKRARTLYF